MDFITNLPLSNNYNSIMAQPNYTTTTSTNASDCLNELFPTEDPNLPPKSSKPYAHDLASNQNYPQPITLKPTDKQNTQTKKLKPTSKSTAGRHPTAGSSRLLTSNSHTTSKPIQSPKRRHLTLSSDMTQSQFHRPPFTQPPPDQIEGHQEFEIEAIVSHKGNGSRRRFLVKWTGYPSSKNQWLPEIALSHATNTLKKYKATKNL
ncbi:hypothetical protein M0805_005482 [Coniferiporia weirii]|nr:hypothetical protein M0805_005482 [Coniferiporia weirii]